MGICQENFPTLLRCERRDHHQANRDSYQSNDNQREEQSIQRTGESEAIIAGYSVSKKGVKGLRSL